MSTENEPEVERSWATEPHAQAIVAAVYFG
jgi:hypothetical protein